MCPRAHVLLRNAYLTRNPTESPSAPQRDTRHPNAWVAEQPSGGSDGTTAPPAGESARTERRPPPMPGTCDRTLQMSGGMARRKEQVQGFWILPFPSLVGDANPEYDAPSSSIQAWRRVDHLAECPERAKLLRVDVVPARRFRRLVGAARWQPQWVCESIWRCTVRASWPKSFATCVSGGSRCPLLSGPCSVSR